MEDRNRFDPRTHERGCMCGACKARRQREADHPSERETAAHNDPPTEEQRQDPKVTEHHHHDHDSERTEAVVRHVKHIAKEVAREAKKPSTYRGGLPHPKKDREWTRRKMAHKRHKHPSFLKTMVAGLIFLWLLHSFYPQLNVPFVPGIVCTGPSGASSTASAAVEQTGLDIPLPTPPLRPPNPLGPLVPKATDTVGKIVKAAIVGVADTVLHAIGSTFMALVSSPPSPADVAAGLRHDAHTLGAITGFIVSGLHGATHDPLAGTNAAYTATGGCGQCPTTAVPVSGPVSDGVRTASRAVLAAGWRGQDAIVATAVAGAESGWRRNARNSIGASGLFQMRLPMHAALFHGENWRDPYANARAAHRLWLNVHQQWSPTWTTYTNGRYRQFLPAAREAIQGSPGSNVATVALKSSTGSTTVDGQRVSTIAARQLALAEQIGRINLTVVQGGYGGNHVAASGTSHNYPGVVDVSPGTVGVEQLLRSVGFAAWARNIPGRSKVGSGAHVHAVSLLDKADNSSPQVVGSWAHHGNGLLGYNNDPAPRPSWVPGLASKIGSGVAVAAQDCASGGGTLPASFGTTGRGFSVGSLNVLGANHHKGDPPTIRMARSVALLGRHHVDVAGLQEFQRPQVAAFDRLAPQFDRFSPPGHPENSIIWRKDTFRMVAHHTVEIPYFFGRLVPMPYALLQYRNGQQFWVVNVHNPADTAWAHHQQRWRDAAVRREIGLLGTLRATGRPVLMVGDMNDHSRFYGPMARTGMRASGGTNIDWVLGSPGIRFSGHSVDRGPLDRAATDHPIVTSRVLLGHTAMAGE